MILTDSFVAPVRLSPSPGEINGPLGKHPALRALVLSAPPGLYQVAIATRGTNTIDRLVPGDEVASGITVAPKERTALFGTPLDDLSLAARGTANPNA